MPTSWRETLANAYLRGAGLEIGALHNPLRLPNSVSVRYVDRFGEADLRRHYPELAQLPLVPVDIVADGEQLDGMAAESQDFVIANHFIEHCADPIGTIKNHLRVLKRGGMLYVAVPDKRSTFDHLRPVTPLAHVIRDHEDGPDWSKWAHFEEWARLVWAPMAGKTEESHAIRAEAERLLALDYSIHYHVWTQAEFLELLLYLQGRLGFELEAYVRNAFDVMVEAIAILRKT